MRLVLCVLVPVVFGAACFEFEPRVDAGIGDEPEGSITGTLSVGDATGQAAGRDQAGVNAVRDMLTAGDDAQRSIHPVGRPARRDGRKLVWRPGDLLVGFPRAAYDRSSVAPVVGRMMDAALRDADASLQGVHFAVQSCTARLWCKVSVKDAQGAVLDAERTALLADRLAKHKEGAIKTVSRNFQMKGFRRPNDDFYGFQWHYQFIHMEPAWDLEVGSDDVVVAVVDSGAVLSHPDLSSRWARDPQNNQIVGQDLLSAAEIDTDGVPGRDTDPTDPGDNLFGDRSSFHGTHCAGLIGAATDNTEGIAGLTWEGRLVPVRVLGDQLSGFEDDILAGIFWAIGDPDLEGVPDNVAPARVVNLSLGGPVDQEAQQRWDDVFAFIFSDPDNLYNDPIFVAAAGNDDADADAVAPANVAGVIAVGALRSVDGIRAPYSNFGSTIDIMAPGGDSSIDLTQDGQGDAVLSTYDNDYDFEQGTSMAAPHVTGVAALLVAQNPTLTHAQVESIIKDSADPAGRCNEGCGSGWLDAFTALLLAGGDIEPVPRLASDTASVFFGDGVALRTFHVLNTGNAEFTYHASISGAQAGLFAVDAPDGVVPPASEGGSVPLVISLTRGGFESGSANVELTTVGLETEQTLLVNIQFNDDPNRVPRTVETIEVAAYVQEDGALKSVARTTTSRDEHFQYAIKGLVAGSYFVFAVADDNRDGTFDANLESVGGYKSTRAPEVVKVKEDQTVDGVDFPVNPNFISGVLGGVGAPCDSDGDCTFAPDAECIVSFGNGYCSRLCDADGNCGDGASCELLDCDDGPCGVCLLTCLSDARCRFDEGYLCDEYGTCTPEDL